MDLSYLRPLYTKPGPWASAYLDATRATPDAAHEVELRWRALGERLSSRGVTARTLDLMARAVFESPRRPGRYGLAVFANRTEAALVEPMPGPPAAEEAYYGPLPHAMPLVAMRGEEIPYVRVLSDRTGAEVTGLSAGGVARREEVEGGDTFPITKVRGGGWSNPRYQRAAEETWRRNAGDVAAAVAELAGAVGAEVIVIGGDVRAAPLIAEKLPRRWRDRVVVTEAGDRSSATEDDFDNITMRAIADVAQRHVREAVDRYQAQRGEGGGSAGLADVVTRLQRAQVDTVLIVNDPSSTDKLWIGPNDPTMVSADPQLLRESGVEHPEQVRADAALLRAIVGTDAQLVLVPAGEVALEHGIGAILRYDDRATAAS
jgi:hypothetical protein